MEELKIYFLFTGLGISLTSFALKVALVFQVLRNCKEKILLLGIYLVLYLGAITLVKFYGKKLSFLFERAYLLHLLMALGLIIWFIYIFSRKSFHRLSLLVLALPCPVCLASMGLSALFYESISGDKWGAYFLLPLTFLFLVFTLQFLLRKVLLPLFSGPLEDLVALLMFLSALYLLGSFYFPGKIEELKGFNFAASAFGGISHLIYLLFFASFFLLLGYFLAKNKDYRS